MNIKEFFRLAADEIPGPIRVGRVSSDVQHALGTHTRTVWLSRYNVEKQLRRHSFAMRGPPPSAYYDHIEDTVAHGDPFRVEGDRVALVSDLRERFDRRFQVVVKVTADKSELYLLSFFPLRENDWNRLRRRNNPIPNIAA